MLRKALTLFSLIGLLLSVGLWGLSYVRLSCGFNLGPVRYSDVDPRLLINTTPETHWESPSGVLIIRGRPSFMSCRVEVRLGAVISYRYIAMDLQNLRIDGFEGFETAWMPQLGSSTPMPLGKMLVVPLWIPAFIFGTIFFLCRPLSQYRRRKRKKLGLCLNCGYDLRGSEDRCPECGAAFKDQGKP